MTVERCIGIMLKVIADAERSKQPDIQSEAPDKLEWPAEILCAKLMVAQEGAAAPYIDRDAFVFPTKRHSRDYRADKVRLAGPLEGAATDHDSRANPPTG